MNCIMHKLHDWNKKGPWQRLWLDSCTKQVVSARACANQFLPCSSSGIALFSIWTVQADSCFDSEQIDTLFISVGGQEGVHFGPEAQNLHMTVRKIVLTPPDASAQNKHHAHVSFKDIKIVHNNLITTWIWESACWLSSASSPNHPWHALWRVAPDHEVRTCALAGFAVWLQPKGYLLAEKGCTNCVCLWERWYKFWWEAYAIYGQLKVGARK